MYDCKCVTIWLSAFNKSTLISANVKMPQDTTKVSKVLVLYLGGTIGMNKNQNNMYIPLEDCFIQKIKHQPELHDEEYAKKHQIEDHLLALSLNEHTIIYEIKEYSPLLDSSNMWHKDWIKVAKDIEAHYENYDGFLILHGTDTLSYTSSALSFMLEGLGKTVIITGSQISIFETRNDARSNFLTALILAGCYRIREVTVFFSNKLMRGNRTVKVNSNILDAFDSPNYPPLINANITLKVREDLIFKPTIDTFRVQSVLDPNVVILTMFPTITLELFKCFFKPPIKGVVLRSFGIGNFPSCRTDLLNYLEGASNDVIIVNISQCTYGGVEALYETGMVLVDVGVLPGYDLTAEAALTKLCYVLALNASFEEKKDMMRRSLRGEMTTEIDNAMLY